MNRRSMNGVILKSLVAALLALSAGCTNKSEPPANEMASTDTTEIVQFELDDAQIAENETDVRSNDDALAPASTDSAIPLPIPSMMPQIAMNSRGACAIVNDGKVTCLKAGGEQPPTNNFKAIFMSYEFDCGILNDGKLTCWPDLSGVKWIPRPSAEESFKGFASGAMNAYGLREDGKLIRWASFALGNEAPSVAKGSFKAIAAGVRHACGIRDDGKVLCWGEKGSGRALSELSRESFKEIYTDAQDKDTCGIRDDGKVLCWGKNEYGQAPPGPSKDAFKAIALGSRHTCGIRDDGKVLCWGKNEYGQAPPGPSKDAFKAIAIHGVNTCGIRTDGKILCWGAESYGPAPRF